jgi:hypothetical protein
MATIKNRLKNVKDVFKSIATLKPIQSNINLKNDKVEKVVNKVVGATSQAAGTAALGLGAAAVAVSTLPKIAAKAATEFAAAKTTTQIAVVGSGLVAGGALSTSKKTRQAVVDTPSNLVNFGENIGEFVENPSLEKAKDIITENPLIAAGAGLIGAAALGKAGTIATSLINTSAIKEQTSILKENAALPAVIPTTNNGFSPLPVTPSTQVLTAGSTSVKKYKRKVKESPRQTQSLRVNIYNQSKVLNSRVYRS